MAVVLSNEDDFTKLVLLEQRDGMIQIRDMLSILLQIQRTLTFRISLNLRALKSVEVVGRIRAKMTGCNRKEGSRMQSLCCNRHCIHLLADVSGTLRRGLQLSRVSLLKAGVVGEGYGGRG